MKVVFTDPRFPERDPYRDKIESLGGEIVSGEFPTREDLRRECAGADILVVRREVIDQEFVDELGDATLIMRNGTGYDNIDVRAATARGVPVSNVPGYGDEEIASHAITLMLAAAHEVVYEDRTVRSDSGYGDRRQYIPMLGGTCGIFGLGRIGRALIEKARGFDMDVVAYDPHLPADLFDRLGVERLDFDQLLERADCISIHGPLTIETHHRFSTPEFEQMKETAVLVNTARGEIIDENALLQAVESGEIWAAGLDVFEFEPPEAAPAFDSDRIVCSPHHAAETERANRRCIEIGREEIRRAMEGEPLQNVVNPSVYSPRPDG